MSSVNEPIQTVTNQNQLPAKVLDVKGLSLHVGDKCLIDNISFDINQAEIFALVGESGSGKSLTSLAVMRLLPEAIQVSSGDVVLDRIDVFSQTESQMQTIRGKRVAMIFQEPMTSLNPVMKVGDQVAEVLRRHLGLKSKAARLSVVELFEEVGIPDADARYDWYPHQLSGGQKQRVMIAMALACEPDLLIADEPTTALDVTIQAQVLDLLKSIRDARGLSILFITHDMGVVYEMADRVAVMKQGKIIEMADKNQFFSAASQPYTQQLLSDAIPAQELKSVEDKAPLLTLNELKVHFPVKKGIFQRTVGHVKAVDGVSLSIAKGQTLALVGESGSGKSTIGQAILKLVNQTDGAVTFIDNENVINLSDLSERQMKPLRKKIQVIFQDPFSALNPRMTISEIIREGMVSLKVGEPTKVWQDQRIDELLSQVGLDIEAKYRYPHEFSGGQRQRIGIARALAVEPELIICDEPTSALDVSVRAQVLKLLDELQQKYQLSYLFITHDLSIIPSIAHQVAVMQKGKIVEQGTVAEVMHNPQHDYTKQLLASAPELIRKAISA
ncbi:ABC transporter ATP-binding protein [Thiomicrorhabdus sediminis]|uniref:ABC transporter ATP-binding protein n=1 Tax=Thiomicrorhabdus sediminis TaxID=2580412 RepID=A0A4P9K554_9GAMM|nr:dipeptide ABC transporter ATP-binding protein [Thiomicrorhabdus sediminis]QCU90099.1 ABC transporter ATP-binding protein [Thiomicrorhabdus sediminis]